MTGAIHGTVTDSTGAVLPGVTIVVSSAALMGTRSTVTDAEGLYRFPALAPGEYTVVFTLDGFEAVRREGVYVALAFTATVNIEMPIATLQEKVIVEPSSPTLDRHSTAISASFDARQLANLPGARSMWAIQAATPAVYLPQFDLGATATGLRGAVSVYGTVGANRPMVEGISVSGINPTGFTLDYGVFEEVSVGTAAHGPEWPWSGVHMQFISKSGGNQYRGALYADYLNNDWQSFNIDEDQIRRGARGGPALSPREANRLSGYRDINADISGYVKPDTLWWYSSVRRQEVSARQVNFPVKPLRTSLMHYSGKATYQATQNNKLVGFGQAGRNYQRNRLDPFGPTGFGVGPGTAINESEESTTEQLAQGWVWKGEWNSIINDTVFFEVRAGQFGANRPQKPHGAAPRFEDVGNLIVAGGNRDWQQNFRSSQVLGALSYFKDGWSATISSWEVSFSERQRPRFGGARIPATCCTSCRIVLQSKCTCSKLLRNPTAAFGVTLPTPRVNNRLTLNLGLRFDRYRSFLPDQAHPPGRFNPTLQTFPAVDNLIDWNVLAPRIGLIHDFAGDGKTVAKLSYGQYWGGPWIDLGFNANPNANQWWRRYRWSDPDGSGVWEPGEEGDLLGSRGGVALESVDPGLELPYVRELAAWVEHELVADIGVRTGVVWRSETQTACARTSTGRSTPSPSRFPFQIRARMGEPARQTMDPRFGARPQARARGAGARKHRPQCVRHRHPVLDVGHHGDPALDRPVVAGGRIRAYLEPRPGERYFGQLVRENIYPLTPNDLINADEGGRYEFRVWSARLYGTYAGPWDVRITPFLRHQSGQPFGRTFVTPTNYGTIRVLAEPIGTRRMDNITMLDVRVEKGVPLGRHRRLAGFVDVFNLLNANPEQNTSWSSGPSFLRPLSIVSPRVARIGMKLEW